MFRHAYYAKAGRIGELRISMKQPFVESNSNDLGTGKLVKRCGSLATVEYFRSPADDEPLRIEVSWNTLSQKPLPEETRAYFLDPDTNRFEVGRILHYQEDDSRYLVRFPNKKSRLLSSDDLMVRCRLPIAEPTDHLARQLNETAYWHAARSEFVRHLLDLHCVSPGLSAMFSSSIEIAAHQASVIHRVLMDPFQRYLLADEVGLGKTIEAGVLLKQFTLDEPSNHKAIIIVPKALCIQWQQELTHRFHLGRFLGKTINIVSSRDISAINRLIGGSRMIVIDEAHHLSSWAWSADREERSIFETVKQASQETDRRLLLLSATPVLHNEKSFLAMLHLLDPQVYPLDSLEHFKDRVRLRQEIAERMLDLSESESNYFLRDTLDVLGELLPKDPEFQRLRRKLGDLIGQDVDEADPGRTDLIRSIRTHINDMWRLHRRILRNRRTNSTALYLPKRDGSKCIVYECHSEKGLADAIEAWRVTLSFALCLASADEKLIASRLALTLDQFAACEPRHAAEFAKARLRGESLYDGEAESLQGVIQAATQCDQVAKLEKLLELLNADDMNASSVIFTDAPETADLICEFLKRRFGHVFRHSTHNRDWTSFMNASKNYILVCDRSAEEGLNLQKRGAIAIHYDLPFSPNRIEQRMGRIDRFGSGGKIRSVVLVCGGSNIQLRWLELLDDAIGVFKQSIASLQYVIDEAIKQLWTEFLDSGSYAFVELNAKLGGDNGVVAKELKKASAQDVIDSFDADQITQEVSDKMEKTDRALATSSSKIFENWVVDRLGFRKKGENERQDKVFNYEFTREVNDCRNRSFGQNTLMPADEFQRLFQTSIDDLPVKLPTQFATHPFTFDRVVAQERSCRLLRAGDSFVDAFESFTRWDDRGVCYAFWRYRPTYLPDNPILFFRFDYVVSPAEQPLEDLCSQYVGICRNALLRRTRAIMKPRFTTIWLDADLERVMNNHEQMPLLRPAFSKTSNTESRDFNLNPDRWKSAATLYDMSLWSDRCVAARERSEKLLREQSKLPELSETCILEAKRLATKVRQQFISRLAIANGENKASLETERAIEEAFLVAQIEAFRKPDLRADSVGAVFLSNQNPFNT